MPRLFKQIQVSRDVTWSQGLYTVALRKKQRKDKDEALELWAPDVSWAKWAKQIMVVVFFLRGVHLFFPFSFEGGVPVLTYFWHFSGFLFVWVFYLF